MYNALRGGRIERVYRLPHQYRPRWNIDGAILDHFISPSVLSSRARNSVARIYIPIDFRPHVETALSKKDRMRANKRRINIRSRSLLGTRREIGHPSWRRPRIRRRRNFLRLKLTVSFEIVQIFNSSSFRGADASFSMNEFRLENAQSRNKHLKPSLETFLALVFSFEPCLSRFPNEICVWLVQIHPRVYSLDSRVKIAEDGETTATTSRTTSSDSESTVSKMV